MFERLLKQQPQTDDPLKRLKKVSGYEQTQTPVQQVKQELSPITETARDIPVEPKPLPKSQGLGTQALTIPSTEKVERVEQPKVSDKYAEQIKQEFGYDPRKSTESFMAGFKQRTSEEKQRLGELQGQYITAKQAEDKQVTFGFYGGLTMGATTELMKRGASEDVRPVVEEAVSSPNFAVGQGAGSIARYGLMYSLLGAPIESGFAKLAGKAGIDVTKGLGGRLATELAKDVVLSAPMTAAESLISGRTTDETKKAVVNDLVFGAVMNGVFEARAIGNLVGDSVKKIFGDKKPSIVKQITDNGLSKESAETIVKSVEDNTDWDRVVQEGQTLLDARTSTPSTRPSLATDFGTEARVPDFYANQFGVADRRLVNQLQLPEPKTIQQPIRSDAFGANLRQPIEADYYHITANKEFKFDPDYSPVWQTMGDGFYATKEVDKWAVPLQAKGTMRNYVVPVDVKNLKIIDAKNLPSQSVMAKEIIKNFDGNSKQALEFVGQFEPTATTLGGKENIEIATEIAYAKTKGFDAIERTTTEGNELLIFNKEKVKTNEPLDIVDFLQGKTQSSKQTSQQPTIERPSEFAIRQPQYPQLNQQTSREIPRTLLPSEANAKVLESAKRIQPTRIEPTLRQPNFERLINPTRNIEPQPLRQIEQPTRTLAEDIGLRGQTLNLRDTRVPQSTREPIDTLSKVLVDVPKKSKAGIGENFERVYQELFAKTAPFESLAKKTDTPLLRAQATNLNRTTGTIDYNIAKAQSDMDGNNIGDSIQDIFKSVNESEKGQFFDYVLNKHNVERYAQGKPVFGDTVTSDISSAKALQYESTNPKFAEQQQKITNYFSNLLNEWGVKSGLVSEETAKMLNDMYPNYVPTYRARDIAKSIGGDGNFVSQILKKAKGSESSILPIDQQMAILTDRTIRNARKNEVMNLLDDVYQSNKEIASRYITDVKKVGEKSTVTDILDVGKEIEKTPVRNGDSYVVTFYKNGEPHQMTVNKTLYEAIATYEKDSVDKVLDTVKKYATNPFKSLITQKNPIFFIRNVMRDIPTALIYSNDSIGLVKNVPDAVKEMVSNGKKWQQFQAMGGTRSGLFNYEKGVKLDFAGQKSPLKQAGEKVSNAMELANNMTETLPRFAEYITSINKGESPAIAMMRAAEITTDFARFGNITKKADAVVPYLNASMQGLDKFFRQLRDKPLQTMAKGGLVVSIPALILDQTNKNNKEYNEMTAFERNNYYHIPVGREFVRIPRSREVGVIFGTLFEWVNRLSRGQEVTSEEVKEVLKSNFTPVNGFDSNILKPALNFIDIATGKNIDAKNYFGGNIVSKSLQQYSPSQQYTENTTSLSKALGEFFDVSPVAIDYLMDAYLGVIADVGMPLLAENKKSITTPLERAFIADPVFKSDNVNKFYNSLDTFNKLSADSNRQYDIPSEEITPYEKVRNSLNKVSKELSDLRKQQKIEEQKGNEELVRQLRQKMNELSKKTVDSLPTEQELKKQFESYLKKRR